MQILVSKNINCWQITSKNKSAGDQLAPGFSGGSFTGTQHFGETAGAVPCTGKGAAPRSPCPQPCSPHVGAQPALQDQTMASSEGQQEEDPFFFTSMVCQQGELLGCSSVLFLSVWEMGGTCPHESGGRRQLLTRAVPHLPNRAGQRKTCLLPPSGQRHGVFRTKPYSSILCSGTSYDDLLSIGKGESPVPAGVQPGSWAAPSVSCSFPMPRWPQLSVHLLSLSSFRR